MLPCRKYKHPYEKCKTKRSLNYNNIDYVFDILKQCPDCVQERGVSTAAQFFTKHCFHSGICLSNNIL